MGFGISVTMIHPTRLLPISLNWSTCDLYGYDYSDSYPGQLCDTHCTQLIFDEIQTGFGRTGTLWASEYSGVVPNMMVLAKSISGDVFPNAAVVHRDIGNKYYLYAIVLRKLGPEDFCRYSIFLPAVWEIRSNTQSARAF